MPGKRLTAAERKLHCALDAGARLRRSYGGQTYFVVTETDKDGIRRGFTVRAETYENYRRKVSGGADHAR